MILVIDNYDSFTYNLVQYLGELGAEMDIVRNDAKPADSFDPARYSGVVISPGPGTPSESGISLPLIERFSRHQRPVLGICLGHQAIAQLFGGNVVRGPAPVHGKSALVSHDGRGIFSGIPSPLAVGRYHSLVVDPTTLPACLEVSASTTDQIIMAVRHRTLPVEGVQFHPESVLTECGKALLGNFLAALPAN